MRRKILTALTCERDRMKTAGKRGRMRIKRGNIVSHTGVHEWGVGKVLEITDVKATIQFSDGIIRKIASSHYTILQPAAQSSFVAHTVKVTPRVNPARQAKVKQPAVKQHAG
jgi:hypothetical protein